MTLPGTLERIASVVGTPVYVYDAATIRNQYERLTSALSGMRHRIHFSVKANSNLAILDLFRRLGAGADIVSGGELARALAAGFGPAAIVFSGVGKSDGELEQAAAARMGLINVESAGEVAALARIVDRLEISVSVGIRVNPDITAETHPYTQTGARGVKFGVPIDEVRTVARQCSEAPGLSLRSVGMHLGSQIADPKPYAEGAAKLADVVSALRADGISSLETLDVGGGLAAAFGPGGQELDLDLFTEALRPAVERTGLTLFVEPGRFLVANAGRLLTRVLYRKHSGGREIVVVDAGMSELVRPSLYRAEHEVTVIVPGTAPEGPHKIDIVGPICESGDFLALDRTLAGATPRALLAVHGAGAYGFTMSSNYNSRPRPAEVLLEGDRWGVIRLRETPDDLFRTETIEPEWQ